MIALSTAPVPFTPSWLIGQAGAPVFHIRPGTLIERARLEAELAGKYAAGTVYPWDLADAMMGAARALLPGLENAEALGQVLEACAALKATLDLSALSQEQRQLLIGMDAALMTWPEYADLRQREANRDQIMPTLACQWFLAGWEGLETPFEADKHGRATEASLRALGPFYLRAVGMEAYRLLSAADQRPLSPPPSKSAPARPTSPAAKRRPSAAKAGKSKAASGRKTRA